MQCCVPFCENSFDTAGITFYEFPTINEIRSAWLQALGKDESQLPCGAQVCSQHFQPDDFSLTEFGLKKLKPKAIPFVMYEFELKPVVDTKLYRYDIEITVEKKRTDPYDETVIKQEPLEEKSEGSCGEVNDSHLEQFKHEAYDGSSETDNVSQQPAAGGLLANSTHTHGAPVPVTPATNAVLTKQEAIEYAETSDIITSESDTVSKGIHCQTTSQYELSASEMPNVEHPTLEVVEKLFSNIEKIVKKIKSTRNIVRKRSKRHVKERKFICDICQKVFKYKHAFTNHVISHNRTTPLTCKICPYQCKFNSEMIKHMKSHSGDKPYACTLCPYKSAQKSNLARHVKTHSEEKTFSCELCDYKSTMSTSLAKHMKSHNKEKPFACTLCEYKCNVNSSLVKHMRTHTGEKPFACVMCEYKCTVNSSLVKHMRTHTGEKPFACELCEYKCAVKGSLKKHMMIHTGERPFACTLCNYRCTVRSKLSVHMRIHLGDKPYACELCEYRCTLKSNLDVHMRKHTGNKPYSCTICEYKCTVNSSLVTHMRIHSGEKPYACKLCEYKTTQNGNLLIHIKRTHQAVMNQVAEDFQQIIEASLPSEKAS